LCLEPWETRLTRRVSLVEQELLILPEHLRSPPNFSGVRVTRSLVLCVCFVDRYTDSDCPFGVFKLFLYKVLIAIYWNKSQCTIFVLHIQRRLFVLLISVELMTSLFNLSLHNFQNDILIVISVSIYHLLGT
jgi:hypothetical protein